MFEVPKYLARLHEATLNPPVSFPQDDDAAAAGIPWVLLDLEAYVADVHNHTTVFSDTERGKTIQVTFCLAPPPRVSYFCVFCRGKDHTVFPMEPKIIAMDENLVLLQIVVGPEDSIYKECPVFIYQADGADDGGPSLERLQAPPGPPCSLPYRKVGLLRCSDGGGGKKDEFIVAALCRLSEPGVEVLIPDDALESASWSPNSGDTHFALFVYNSKTKAWTVNLVSVDKQQLQEQPGDSFRHRNSKVIAIGGEGGTMGFVDLFRGILLCDVLKGDTKLRYIPLPKPIWPGKRLRGDARLHRDIAVIEDHIKYVELQVNWIPDIVTSDGRYHSDGWTAKTFSRLVAAANSDADDWRQECEVKSSDEINVNSSPHLELLPKPLDSEGRPLPPFKSIVVCQPTLSLGNRDDLVYLMIKDIPGDAKGSVIAVDMKEKKLLGAAKFAAERTDVVTFAYVHSRISKYLTGAAGAKGSHGHMLVRSSTPASISQIHQPPVFDCLDARM